MSADGKQLGEDRASFMGRVRKAIGREQAEAPTDVPAVDESLARLARETDDLVGMFAAKAESVGMVVHRVGPGEALSKVGALVAEAGGKKVGITEPAARVLAGGGVAVGPAEGPEAEEEGSPVQKAMDEAGAEVVGWSEQAGLDVQFDLDVGITGVEAALAETGTLVCCSGSGTSRGLSLVPGTHVAVVRESDIVPDMLDYWARVKGIRGEELPSAIAFITGPSKTADIEGELITGVHGPEMVHVVLVGES